MNNKIKKIGVLFMALMLIVSSFGNLGTVFAEDDNTIANEEWKLDDFIVEHDSHNNQLILFGLSDKGMEKIKTNKDLVIPDGVNIIDGSARFIGMQIKSVTFPDSLVAIYGHAFMDNEIEQIKFGKSLKEIDGGAFYVNNITELVIPESVKEISGNAFAGNRIRKLTLHKDLHLHSGIMGGQEVFAGQNAEYYPKTNPFPANSIGCEQLDVKYLFMDQAVSDPHINPPFVSQNSKILKLENGQFKFSTGIKSVKLFFTNADKDGNLNDDFGYSGEITIYNPEQYNPIVSEIKTFKNKIITIDQYKSQIKNLPEDINGVELKVPADTSTTGKKTAIVTMIFEDNSKIDIEIPVNVFKNKADMIDDEFGKNDIHAEKEIVPWGGKYDLTDNIVGITDDMGITGKTDVTEPKIDTKKSGDYVGQVKLEFDDGSSTIVNVPVTVLKSQAEENNPNGKDLTVNVGEEPKAEDAITNKGDLPDGTKYEWKEKPDTTKPGEENSVVIVTYPDGSKDEVVVKVNVIDPKTDAEKYPANKPTKTEVEDKNNLTPDEKTKVAEEVKKVNPEAKDIEVKDNGDTTITYPDGSTNTLPGEDTVVEKAKEDIPLTPLTPAEEYIPLTPLTPAEEIEKPVEPKKDYSREPKVDPIYEGDEKITGKGEPRSDIEIKLPNRKTAYGRTDREGYFEIKIGIKLYEDEKIYVTQIEDGKEPSKEVVETVKRSYRHKDNRIKNNNTKTTSTSDVVGVLNSVQDKLITKDHYSYIVGYPDGGFKPANTITRAEVATIFARLSKDQSVGSNVTFKDVKANDWFNKAVKIGVSQGFINGFGDGTFKPNKPITRAEFASVISTYANKSKATNAFGDVDGWAAGAIDTAYANGWMQGNAGKFRPNDPLTRAEAVTVINRMLNRQADKAFIANAINNRAARAYNDINADQWFFYDVYAASWGHNYTIENGVEKWTGLNGKAFTIR